MNFAHVGRGRVTRLLALCLASALGIVAPACSAIDVVAASTAPAPASALLAVDTNRRAIVARIVNEWGARLAALPDGVAPAELEKMLGAMRADQLLAASLVGSLEGLKAIVTTNVLAEPSRANARPDEKALGDANADLVYTPVAPCRLFDTRTIQGGQGTPTLGTRRTFGAVIPVTNQGGPGGCAAAGGATVALIQIGTLTPSANGLLQGGPQGAASFPNALILYQPGDQYGTAVAISLNPANGQFDLVEQFGTADLYGDLLGFFKPASGFVAGVTVGNGLAQGGTASNPTISIPAGGVTATMLNQSGCATGQVLKWNGSGWTCQADANSGGTVTSVATGSGLTGGTITGSGTIGLAGTQLLPTAPCLTNQVLRWNGTAWNCSTEILPQVLAVTDHTNTTLTPGVCTHPPGAFITFTPPASGSVLISADALMFVDHLSAVYQSIFLYIGTSPTDCFEYPDFSLASMAYVTASMPLDIYQITVPVHRKFDVNPRTQYTFYLNGRYSQSQGSAQNAGFSFSNLTLQFFP